MPDQTQLVDELRRRIADPGACLPRRFDAGHPVETMAAWRARAVAASLEDGTLGYVPAAAQLHRADFDRLAGERDRWKNHSTTVQADCDRLAAEVDALDNRVRLLLIRPDGDRQDHETITVAELRNAINSGTASVPGVEIPLTRGLVALVDQADYEAVTAIGSWCASPSYDGLRTYAKRSMRKPDGSKTTQFLHTFITGWPYVDHINGDGLDNRRVNLRPATVAQNNRNTRLSRNNASGFKGVHWVTKRSCWRACISVNGKNRHVGHFATAEEAARAYDAAARQHFGEYARLNFPTADSTTGSPVPSRRAQEPTDADLMLESAWGVIANVGNPLGDWDSMPQQWREAAVEWARGYHAWLDERAAGGSQASEPAERLATTEPATTDPIEEIDHVHTWFGLSYSNYQVLPRTLMQSMPAEWQQRMVACLEELREAFSHIEHPDAYEVTAAVECYYSDLNEADMKALGVTRPDAPDGDDEDAELPDVYYDRDGVEHEGEERVLVPRPDGDPIPHYNRGRTRIAPRIAVGPKLAQGGRRG